MALSEWLAENGCTHVAMEATGVYWKPVWHILDDGDFQLILANASHVKNVPGRKTDVNDATFVELSDKLDCRIASEIIVPGCELVTFLERHVLHTRVFERASRVAVTGGPGAS